MGCQGTATDDQGLNHALNLAGSPNDPKKGFNPIDKVMWSHPRKKPINYLKVLESDLDVIRLLVETAGLERIDSKFLICGIVLKTKLNQSHAPPALEYLCKQEFFPFSLSTVVSSNFSKNFKPYPKLINRPVYKMSSLLRAISTCSNDFTTIDSGLMNKLMFATLANYAHADFKDFEEQKKEFNEAVIAFALFLKQGFHPSDKLCVKDMPVTVARLALADEMFTLIAWRLALELNGWVLPPPPEDLMASRHWEVSKNGARSTEKIAYRSDVESTVSTADIDQNLSKYSESGSKGSEDKHRVPGAWVAEELDPPLITIQRRFRSRFCDFRGIIDGREWDTELYLSSEHEIATRHKEERPLSWFF